jgi:hypothetical protein
MKLFFGEGTANKSWTKDDNTNILLKRKGIRMNAGKLTPFFPH